jgi:ribosomal protein S6
MRIYEINYIISGSSSEDEVKIISEKINGYISESGGKVEKKSEPIKKSLGFKMSGRKDIFFNSVIFSMPSESLVEFEKKVKAESGISRYNLLKRDKVESSSLRDFSIRRRRPLIPSDNLPNLDKQLDKQLEVETEKKDHSKPRKADLKEIDQTIEEILK